MTVLVIGGGIGGLVTAMSLHQVGIPVRIFEKQRVPTPLGVGMTLVPHAVRELINLGLADALAEIGRPLSDFGYYNKHGQSVWKEKRGLEAGYRWPQYTLDRAVFQQMLLAETVRRIGAENIVTGHGLRDFEMRTDGVSVVFDVEDPAPIVRAEEGSLLVGCDGIASGVRAVLNPEEGAPNWNGAILWRGVSPGQSTGDGYGMTVSGHEGQKFVCYPIPRGKSGGTVNNWIAELRFRSDHDWRVEDWNRTGHPMDFLPAFEDWVFDWLDVPGTIRAAERIYEYPMIDRDPLRRWSYGRVTLLGDAAHPTHPIGFCGASQAIIDARCLAREIAFKGATPEALTAYEEARRLPAKRVTLANRQNGPEQVLAIAEQRAPDGFDRIDDVVPIAEMKSIVDDYKSIAGIDRETVNSQESIVPPELYVTP